MAQSNLQRLEEEEEETNSVPITPRVGIILSELQKGKMIY